MQLDFDNLELAFRHKSDRQLRRSAILFQLMNSNFFTKVSTFLGLLALKLRIPFTEWGIYKTIFAQFVGGRTLLETQETVDELFDYNVLTMLDIGIERSKSSADIERVKDESLKAIHFAGMNEAVPVITTKLTGLADMKLLEKYGNGDMTVQDHEAFDLLFERLNLICKTASDQKVGVFIDAEETWIQDAIHDLAMKMIRKYNLDEPIVYNTYQMYRVDRLELIKKDIESAKAEGFILGVKLVRGAYMEKENERAENLGLVSPIHKTKEACDQDYNEALELCLENYHHVSLSNATHNRTSTSLMVDYLLKNNLPVDHKHFNFCQLYGMGDFFSFNLANSGFRAAKYVPYGKVRDVFPYLVRRAKENSSVSGEVSRELKLIKMEIARRKTIAKAQQ